MNSIEVLVDGFGRVRENVHRILDGIDEQRLGYHPAPGANSIAWLIWHLTRVQDSHIADAAGTPQVWHAQGWAESFALPFPESATGYGQTTQEALRVVAEPDQLLGYYDATHEATLAYLDTLSDADLDRIVDTTWDPPVTLGVRLVSVVDDDTQHVGQAAYVRGLPMP
ncbi:DUF664 domain-containing protein [Gordonia sinesedis]